MNLGVMEIKAYSSLPKALGLKSRNRCSFVSYPEHTLALNNPRNLIYLYTKKPNKTYPPPKKIMAQSAWASEYTNYTDNISGHDTKKSDGEAPVILELCGMLSNPSLSSLPGSLWPGVVAPDRVLSMGQTQPSCVFKLTELFEIELIICIKIDFALNNLQWLICHKT